MAIPQKSLAPALFVDEDGNFKVIHNVPIPDLVEGEVVVKTVFSGVNPADVKHGPMLGVKPTIIGYDFCGRVVKANGASKFKVGDFVAGFTPTGIGKPPRYGAHQEYLASPEEIVFKVPDNLPHAHAASITCVVSTAADGLYNVFGLPVPGQKPDGQFKAGPILIWGGATSVGLSMVQLARASGAFPIFVTASPKRHEVLGKLGATRCFDYNAPDVAAQIKAAVEEAKVGPILYAADCAGAYSPVNSGSQMAACVGDEAALVSVVGRPDKRFTMVFASAHATVTMRIGGGPVMTFPARPEAFERMWKTVTWAAENYGAGFSIPAVEVFEGPAEEALAEVKKAAEQGRFGKLVLKQPLL
ncbi:hypothetical protein CCHL11_02610 [Colletotrichum chlorophyti]|uniref:Enoyl reductase (ER) domain-containing protein n=1 Tax=Colletotrichum chlorophyti TaxID=708187 RepID=A0A1Q8S8P9_9PEZI|nr:hypothetical protein CCHL11_02610 [Colletotrichum chlorophyti]